MAAYDDVNEFKRQFVMIKYIYTGIYTSLKMNFGVAINRKLRGKYTF